MDALSKYVVARDDFAALVQCAKDLSTRTTDIPTREWHVLTASAIFTKICCHAIAILKLAPTEIPPSECGGEIWDLSSLAALTRALVDAYGVLVYVAIEPVAPEERELRRAVWEYHRERKRLQLLDLNRASSLEVDSLRKEVDTLKEHMVGHGNFVLLDSSVQRDASEGKLSQLKPNAELVVAAGISKTYYRTAFRYLSSYVHTDGFSTAQLREFNAVKSEAQNLLTTTLQFATAFLAFAIRDYQTIFPTENMKGLSEVTQLIEFWDYCGQHWEEIETMDPTS